MAERVRRLRLPRSRGAGRYRLQREASSSVLPPEGGSGLRHRTDTHRPCPRAAAAGLVQLNNLRRLGSRKVFERPGETAPAGGFAPTDPLRARCGLIRITDEAAGWRRDTPAARTGGAWFASADRLFAIRLQTLYLAGVGADRGAGRPRSRDRAPFTSHARCSIVRKRTHNVSEAPEGTAARGARERQARRPAGAPGESQVREHDGCPGSG